MPGGAQLELAGGKWGEVQPQASTQQNKSRKEGVDSM